MQYGFEPLLHTSRSVAGLGRFNELIGTPVFQSLCGKSASAFAAIPSLYAVYILITTIYTVISWQRKAVIALFAIICMGIWQTVMYTSHHCLISVVLGITTRAVTTMTLEYLLLRVPSIRDTFNDYIHRIS